MTTRRQHWPGGPCLTEQSTSVGVEMTTDPNQIRSLISAILAELPDTDSESGPTTAGEVDIDTIAQRLDEAHDVLVLALESVEKG